ncbi:MAG: alpha/beta fold hydrolase [Balneolales bacterium]|nr:alpha/beta fold hydrolase [Balneolales bacterium]
MKYRWLFNTLFAVLGAILCFAFFVIGLLLTNGVWSGFPALVISFGIYIVVFWWLRSRKDSFYGKFFILLPSHLAMLIVIWAMIPLTQYDFGADDDTQEYGFEFWDAGNDRVIAVGRMQPPDDIERRNITIVFIHGGPGAFARNIDIDFLATLTQQGFDILYYDQLGAGRSGTVPVTEYSHDGNVQDLKYIMGSIDQPVILFGQSYGAGVITSFMAKYAELFDVHKLILSEPSPLPGFDPNVDDPHLTTKTTSASSPDQPDFFELIRSPRLPLSFMLPAGNQFVPQKEIMRSVSPAFQFRVMKTSYCSEQADNMLPIVHHPINLSAMMEIRRSFMRAERPDLRDLGIPVQLLLGECSYIPRGLAMEYFEHYSISRSHWIPEVGHVLWTTPDGSRLTREAIISFIDNTEPPLPNRPTYETRQQFVERGY